MSPADVRREQRAARRRTLAILTQRRLARQQAHPPAPQDRAVSRAARASG